jgi:hypothetical protein
VKSNQILLLLRWFAAAKARLAARIRRREGRARALTFAESLAAGAIAGVVNNLCTIPFDVVEAERRAASRRKREKKNGIAPEPPSAALSRLAASLADRADIARRIAARRGVASLWRGAGASCVLVLGPAANFAAFDRLKRAFLSLASSSGGGSRAAAAQETRSHLGFVEAFVLGAAAKAFAIALATPVTRAAVIARAAERGRAARTVGGERRSATTRNVTNASREETRRRRPVDDDDADEGSGASGGVGEDGDGAPRGEGEDRSEEDASDPSDPSSASFSFAARVRLWSEAVSRATREGGVGSLWAGAGGARFARSAFAAAVMFAVRERLDAAVGGGGGG